METKTYYVRKELILEIEVEQNPDKHTETPIHPMECRLEWNVKGIKPLHEQVTEILNIDPNDLRVVEDEMTRQHKVTRVRVANDGPRSSMVGPSLFGMSEKMLVETEEQTATVAMDEIDDSEALHSDTVTPMRRKLRRSVQHLHLPHELHRHYGANWGEEIDWDYYDYATLGEPERTETDLTDYMPKDEIEPNKTKQWGILRVIEGGKVTKKK